jgi:hypothetical protein
MEVLLGKPPRMTRDVAQRAGRPCQRSMPPGST